MWNLFLGFLSFVMSVKVTPIKIIKIVDSFGSREKNNLEFVSPELIRCSVMQKQMDSCRSLKELIGEWTQFAQNSAQAGAQVVVFPEYIGLTCLGLVPFCKKVLSHIIEQGSMQNLKELKFDEIKLKQAVEAFHNFIYEVYMYAFSAIAKNQKIYIVAGSSLFYEKGSLYNRCVVFGPDGQPVGSQDKTASIGLDKLLGVAASDVIEVISTPFGGLGVVLGSDAYYFECFKIAKARGAKIIAAPGIGEIGALGDILRCRANENGQYVLFSPLNFTDNEQAGIFAPLEITPEKDGIVAREKEQGTQMLTARLNLPKLEKNFDIYYNDPNKEFLQGDYLHSYCYSGKLPLFDQEKHRQQMEEISS